MRDTLEVLFYYACWGAGLFMIYLILDGLGVA